MPDRLESLKSLRVWRVPPDRDDSIATGVRSALREAAARVRSTGGVTAAWEAAAPQVLLRSCKATGGGKGLLTIRAGNAAVRFQLDRWLAGGGEAALKSGGVLKVRVT